MRLSQRALDDVHGRLDELTAVVTEWLTAAAQAGQLEWTVVRAIVAQVVDEVRRTPLPAPGGTAEDDGQGLERALANTERHPTDTTAVRRLADEMASTGGRLGQTALELAPAFLSDQDAADRSSPRTRTTSGSMGKRRWPYAATRSPATATHWQAPGSDHQQPAVATALGAGRCSPLRPAPGGGAPCPNHSLIISRVPTRDSP